jgi:predicted Rossmann-fold nucleotide-binding protein
LVETIRVLLGEVDTCGLGGGVGAINEAMEVMTFEKGLHKATPSHIVFFVEFGDGLGKV